MTGTALIIYLWAMGGLFIGAIFRRDMGANVMETIFVILTWPFALPAALILDAYAESRKK